MNFPYFYIHDKGTNLKSVCKRFHPRKRKTKHKWIPFPYHHQKQQQLTKNLSSTMKTKKKTNAPRLTTFNIQEMILFWIGGSTCMSALFALHGSTTSAHTPLFYISKYRTRNEQRTNAGKVCQRCASCTIFSSIFELHA